MVNIRTLTELTWWLTLIYDGISITHISMQFSSFRSWTNSSVSKTPLIPSITYGIWYINLHQIRKQLNSLQIGFLANRMVNLRFRFIPLYRYVLSWLVTCSLFLVSFKALSSSMSYITGESSSLYTLNFVDTKPEISYL